MLYIYMHIREKESKRNWNQNTHVVIIKKFVAKYNVHAKNVGEPKAEEVLVNRRFRYKHEHILHKAEEVLVNERFRYQKEHSLPKAEEVLVNGWFRHKNEHSLPKADEVLLNGWLRNKNVHSLPKSESLVNGWFQ